MGIGAQKAHKQRFNQIAKDWRVLANLLKAIASICIQAATLLNQSANICIQVAKD